MRTPICLALSCFAIVAFSSLGFPYADPVDHPSRLMFTKSLSDGSKINVYGQQMKPDGFKAILGEKDFGQLAAVLSYHAELCPPEHGQPVTIWSALEKCNTGWAGRDTSEVLDVGCGAGQFVVILWCGGQLWAYYHDFNGLPSSGVVCIPTDWTIYPTPQPFDPNVTKAALALSKDGLWSLHVVEQDDQTGKVTDFEKDSEKWEFKATNSVKLK